MKKSERAAKLYQIMKLKNAVAVAGGEQGKKEAPKVEEPKKEETSEERYKRQVKENESDLRTLGDLKKEFDRTILLFG